MKGIRGKPSPGLLLTIGLVVALSALACLLLYRVDNKYDGSGPMGREGILDLRDWNAEEEKPVHLISGWAYYGGRLLTPADLIGDAPAPDRYQFIGEYGGLEGGGPSPSPHGSASYRLTLLLPDQPRPYALELPEIYSAYRAYLNGQLVMELGEPELARYRPATGNRTVAFSAGGKAELLIAVSDFSGFYSGMVYPPVFGSPEAVSGLLYSRFLFRAVLCACALTIGLLALLVGALGRRIMPTALYGLLCLFFVGFAAYPITRTLWDGSPLSYGAERFSFCVMLLLAALLARHVSGAAGKGSLAFFIFAGAVCLASLLIPLGIAAGSLSAMRLYSRLISCYEWAASAYLLLSLLTGPAQNPRYSGPILCGAAAFATSLAMDRALPLFEPVITGWFVELFSFVLILAIGASIGLEVAAQYREKAVLDERVGGMERLLSLQRTHHAALRKEMEETKAIRHDMRHHFHVIRGYVERAAYEDLGNYIQSFGEQIPAGGRAEYSANSVVNILAHHYGFLARQNGIEYVFRCNTDEALAISDADLCGILSNLLENAVEACLRTGEDRRYLQVAVAQLGRMLTIRVENSTDDGLRPLGGGFLSTKGDGRGSGYGLASASAIARRYDGTADFTWDRENRAFASRVTLMQDPCDSNGKEDPEEK